MIQDALDVLYKDPRGKNEELFLFQDQEAPQRSLRMGLAIASMVYIQPPSYRRKYIWLLEELSKGDITQLVKLFEEK